MAGFWQGIERGIGAINKRDSEEADRKLRQEAYDESKRTVGRRTQAERV